jgi:hypothetical protein
MTMLTDAEINQSLDRFVAGIKQVAKGSLDGANVDKELKGVWNAILEANGNSNQGPTEGLVKIFIDQHPALQSRQTALLAIAGIGNVYGGYLDEKNAKPGMEQTLFKGILYRSYDGTAISYAAAVLDGADQPSKSAALKQGFYQGLIKEALKEHDQNGPAYAAIADHVFSQYNGAAGLNKFGKIYTSLSNEDQAAFKTMVQGFDPQGINGGLIEGMLKKIEEIKAGPQGDIAKPSASTGQALDVALATIPNLEALKSAGNLTHADGSVSQAVLNARSAAAIRTV